MLLNYLRQHWLCFLIGGVIGFLISGAGTFFGYELPESLMPVGLVVWLTLILGVGVGPLLAWNKR